MNEKISNVPYDYSLNLINCTKTIESVDQQTNFQYNHVHMSSNYQYQYSTNTNLYNNAAPTQTLKNQNLPLGLYQENVDFLNWDNNRIINDNKIDLNELTNNKDLSPTIDTLIPTECYKTSSSLLSTANNKINPSLCEGNQSWNHIENNYQKTYELPSCAQQQIDGNNYEYDKGRYFSIEKTQEFDTFVKTTTTSSSSTTAAYTTYNNDLLNENSYRTNKLQEYNNTSFNNYYETNVIDSIENGLFQDCIPFEPIMGPPPQTPADELVDDEDEESDIIVEESEDDCGGEERIYSHMNKCVICNMIYTLHGRQFYFLTIENPLTMTTQKPVLNKMVEFVGKINTTADQNLYLCSECLSLINTIDQLQLKLKSLTTELLNKFQKTCKDNNIQCDENNQQQQQQQLLPSTKYYKKNRRNVNRRYQCKICKKVLSIKKVFQLHSILKHHDNNNKIASEYLCEMCGKIFPTKTKFKFHTSSKKCSKFIPKIYGFKCTNCTKVFRTKTNLKEHENSCLGRLPYICTRENCHKKFASTTRLKNHVKLKHDKKFTSICSICNIGFVNISEYKTHMLSHSTEKKYTCTKCNKSYKTRSNLNFHMKVHNDKMPFNCTICKKGFLRKDYLEAHVNNHNGIKNFTCTICNKKFVTQKNLDSHTKYHDGSVKKYTCNICGKIMTTGFQEHLRIHNNLLEFHCDLCNVKFNTKITLSKHKKSKHSFVS